MDREEAARALSGQEKSSFYKDSLAKSAEFRKTYAAQKTVVKAAEMPWEDSPQGRIKHMVNEELNTKEYCLDIYQQVIEGGECSGKHRHLSEEVLYILEGKGYDLHWDVAFDCGDTYVWDWHKEPQKVEWEEGDFVYIPPYTAHQHFNADGEKPVRFVSVTSRIIKAMGFDWFDQLENAPGYKEEK
ncbi:cupin domain-containing protein [Paradesulfitobacterium ferrireducens]|uniref:cupin domain-containing protein n=1 Tax=Paradesulfitobacterium ferrireducens TaxID=2816476 RepID=UPI001A907A70|nr:cupin domain-containing protein [Paradesulfitobacterium ferrireducens]